MKAFYSFAIFLTVVYIACGLFQTVIFFRLGAAMYEVPSFSDWAIFMYAIHLSWSLLMAKYFYDKDYPFAFWTLAASIAASLLQFYSYYNLLATRELSTSYVLTTLLVIAAGMLHAVSLLYSSAAERLWLKMAGALQLLLGMTIALSFTWAIVSVSARLNGTIERLEQWISLAMSVIPVSFLLNFVSERATAKKGDPVPGRILNDVIRFGFLIALISGFFFVPRFASESFSPRDDRRNVSEELKKIAEPFEEHIFAGSLGDSLPYRLMKPLDYDSTRRYPLVVCLHGSSAVGTDNVKQVAATLPAQLLSTPDNRRKYPAFLFVPQCPRGFGWGGLPEHQTIDSLVFEAISALENEYSVDTTRRYVTGYSMGGYGAWHFIFSRPEMFAAAVPICGGGDPRLASIAVDIPVWAFHGAKDMNVPVSQTRELIKAIREAGGNPRYTEFPNAAHNIWEEVMQTRELPEWLFAQEKGS